MKYIVIITCLFLATPTAFAKRKGNRAKEAHATVHVLSRRLDTFFFRVEKEMLGGEIEIVSPEGEKMRSTILTKKHGLVDFYYENPGVYRIIFRKGNVVETFEYYKTTPSPYIPIEIVHLNIEQ